MASKTDRATRNARLLAIAITLLLLGTVLVSLLSR